MLRRPAIAFLLGVPVVLLAIAGPATAAPMTVTNLGQPGMISAVPQPPLTLESRGSCREARTLGEANGAASPCPAGTWPTPGGREWGPSVESVRGDVLALGFATPPEDVLVTLTSNHPVGLTTPPYPGSGPGDPGRPGDPVPNVAYGPATVTADPDDPSRRLVTVPDDGRPSWAHDPMYAAVTVRTADGGGENHVVVLSPGRVTVYGTDCGEIWRDPGPTMPYCPRDVVPPGLPSMTSVRPAGVGAVPSGPSGTADSRPLPSRAAVRTGRPTARLAGRALRIVVPGASAGTLRVRATWRGRTLGEASRTVRRSGQVFVRLPVARADRRRLRTERRPRLRIVTTASVPGSRPVAKRTSVVALASR